ncbi:uncharacterized protein C8R40DRAFT_1137031 [Lentinula edodes]|uniref:uncharacterized protein n=1 Tax=Lentinula edodes TaxID=5353 RepID=UPI001E8E5043|nr:uncharacterized protein C8R40DRAFT_1137031 [Lentinula edodes]KAH7867874.1 hypothetical protein C8R40DRAFT_1137031 [Lentinula edodes]
MCEKLFGFVSSTCALEGIIFTWRRRRFLKACSCRRSRNAESRHVATAGTGRRKGVRW